MNSNVCHPTILPQHLSSIVTMPILTQPSVPVTMPIREKPKVIMIQPKK